MGLVGGRVERWGGEGRGAGSTHATARKPLRKEQEKKLQKAMLPRLQRACVSGCETAAWRGGGGVGGQPSKDARSRGADGADR